MGFFATGNEHSSSSPGNPTPDGNDDVIREAPANEDSEKQVPIHDDDVQTALPQIPSPPPYTSTPRWKLECSGSWI
ncbi:uncharacterized protein ATNIH1004_008605 [Aspergillus tanneri]|uniref:Uncharacterized protein n=1 Tax=Aspergillus tanneri TaxID=1220188 RepID=A0A5M9MC02_9EURO|nr:uncharacterized protein ATNIH1004_008605 [Aspergillus tanneri]KAA8644401.1 hypothetical protein ATNIH1004_008605 [Aspergillus tanneri]